MNLGRSYVELILLVAVARLIDLLVFWPRRDGRPLREWLPPYRLTLVVAQLLALGGPLAERWVRRPDWHPTLAAAMLGVLLFTTMLRAWTLLSMSRKGDGPHGRANVADDEVGALSLRGPQLHVRHPIAVATWLEVVALPLIGSAWLTAALCGTLYAWGMHRRVLAEERRAVEIAFARVTSPAERRPPGFRVIPGGRDRPDPHRA